ncbi:MAG: AAA family ATPase [Thermodesulfobacteriota bacterium]|nr:AAA family ATPase [Thermodesulfobacteriota bacterium]
MATIFSIVNQRDGVGKTTTAVNLALCLGLFEKETLLVDCDPQGEASACLVTEHENGDKPHTLYRALSGGSLPPALIRDSVLDFLKVMPAHIDLFQAEQQFPGTAGREGALRELLKRVRSSFDYIIIDAPSSLGYLTTAAIVAADALIVPVECRDGALRHLGYLLKTVTRLRKQFNPAMRISGIVFTKCDSDDEIYRQFPAASYESIRDIVFSTTIGRSSRMAHAGPDRQSLILQDIMADVSADYLDLAAALAEQ